MLVEGVSKVFRIGNQCDGTWFGKGFKAYDGTEKFHTIVCGEFISFGIGGFVKDTVFVNVVKDGAITAGAGVSFGGTV